MTRRSRGIHVSFVRWRAIFDACLCNYPARHPTTHWCREQYNKGLTVAQAVRVWRKAYVI